MSSGNPGEISRNRTWRSSAAAGLLAASAFAAAGAVAHRARHTWPYTPVLEQVHLDHAFPKANRTPLRIGFVTDLHVGPTVRAQDVDRALALLFDAEPDLLLLGGDFVCESPRFIPEAAAILGDYAISAPLGTLAVLGNHDYSNDAPRLTRHLERRGIRVLRNEAAPISKTRGCLWVAGIDDAMLSIPDPERAFSCVPEGSASLSLWHEPDWAYRVSPFGPFLQLSGHSHGGQVRLPFLGDLAAPAGGRRFVSGMHCVDGMRIYTSRGVGAYRPPVRFRCPPEVTLLNVL